ncbi:3-hydroxyacyl-CoA dehydrogenase [Sphingomonas baiyangensis]|uniref:3-hydroxyacyl-CoA dehydrogenase n=1 Tax=Sphingomonas baiyangensis TaxID=2572576 RepID=A0A4U1KZU7_9SPHN|nr:3-hydroxyacyl-CoA dehydrogenase [Sphingomonas baiyangensis]TKD49961.1 3-hydroxyacyl-CoA dehydrogenase [Sphingomonas baiyangensis]
MATEQQSNIAILGAGTIGRGFAVAFAAAGHSMRLYDPDAAQVDAAREQALASLASLAHHGLLDGAPEVIAARITPATTLAHAVADAALVQECGPERAEVKAAILGEADAHAPPHAVLASASSALPASAYAADLAGRARCLVAHPGNPPFLLRVIELVPAPFTDTETVARAAAIFTAAGLHPVHVAREIEGFVFNRLQGAMLREAYALVRDGIASVEDIDRIVRDGLGLRWSAVGPFETVDLNTQGGIAEHARRLGPAYARMGAERGQHDPWTEQLVADVVRQRRALLPLEDWSARGAWRDAAIMRTLAARKAASD